MCINPKSTIAQLLFVSHPLPNFAKIVGELDTALDRCPAEHRSLTWDCEDVAIFEVDAMRIVLGYGDRPGKGYLCCLTIAVGPTTADGAVTALTRRHDGLCRMVVDRVQQRYPVEAVLWHEGAAPVTPDTIDNLLDGLPNRSEIADLQDVIRQQPAAEHDTAPQPQPTAAPAAEPVFSPMAEPIAEPVAIAAAPPRRAIRLTPHHAATRPEAATPVANDIPDLPRLQQEDLRRMRLALYPEEAPDYAAPPDQGVLARRLAVHAMNTTLIMVSLPVGAALLTYSVLRGEDMRLTGRAIALTGAALVFMQSHFGQQVLGLV